MAEDELYFPQDWSEEEDDTEEEPLKLAMDIDGDVFRLAGKVVQHTYDESEWTLDARRVRHPFPHEINMILIAGLEGKLYGDALNVFQNLQQTPGEWFGVVFQNNYPQLNTCYLPRNILWDDARGKYDCSEMKEAEKKQYSLYRLPEGGSVALRLISEICPGLVEELWNLPFNKLPEEIQSSARVWIPPRGEAWPMARVGYKGFGIVGGQSYTLMATRGVQVKNVS